jgi:hypothetical protein
VKTKVFQQFSVDGRYLRWIRKAVGLPEALKELDESSMSNRNSLPLKRVQEKLKLPPLKYANLANRTAFLCGGALTSWIGGMPISDWDFFFPGLESAQLFHDRLMQTGRVEMIGYQGDPVYRQVYERIKAGEVKITDISANDLQNENIRALNYAVKVAEHVWDKIQIVLVIQGENPIQIIETFDFSISMLGTDGRDLYFGSYTWTDLSRKRLRTHSIHHGISTMRRMVKYAQRGFYACTGTMRAIAQGVLDAPSDQPISLD